MTEERVVKVPMKVELIRRMDRALSEARGGFTTRAEFMSEAVQQLLVEISYEDAPAEPAVASQHLDGGALTNGPPSRTLGDGAGTPPSAKPSPTDLSRLLEDLPPWEQPAVTLGDLTGTALRFEGRGAVIDGAHPEVESEPLLGLHNRDYPSIWVAHRLAAYTTTDVLPWREFLSRVTIDAWRYAAGLRDLEAAGVGRRLTALFPANPRKWQSAERGFQTFAVGSVPRRTTDGDFRVSGPLFVWRVCQVQRRNDTLVVGLTTEGWDLLEALDGISLDVPHSPELTAVFMAHLRRHAPADWWGFEHALSVVAEKPDRDALVLAFADARPEWTGAMANSFAQGYVARGREWGLIEPKQVDGRYWLTDFGRRELEEAQPVGPQLATPALDVPQSASRPRR